MLHHKKEQETLHVNQNIISHHGGSSHDDPLYHFTQNEITSGSISSARKQILKDTESYNFQPRQQKNDIPLGEPYETGNSLETVDGTTKSGRQHQTASSTKTEQNEQQYSTHSSQGSTYWRSPTAHSIADDSGGNSVIRPSAVYETSNTYYTQNENSEKNKKIYIERGSSMHDAKYGSITGHQESHGSSYWNHQENFRYNSGLIGNEHAGSALSGPWLPVGPAAHQQQPMASRNFHYENQFLPVPNNHGNGLKISYYNPP